MVFLYFLFLINSVVTTTQSSCNGQCGAHMIRTGRTNVDGYALEGHVIDSYNVTDESECFKACIENDCRCMSFNYRLTKNGGSLLYECELNKEDKASDPGSLKLRKNWRYQDIITRPTISEELNCTRRSCVNSCCEPNPCQHNTTCTTLCDTIRRFTCHCPLGLSGRFCEDVEFLSCADYFKQNKSLRSGMYLVRDNTRKEYYVYCEMDNATETAWTLVQSYSLAHNTEFKKLPFSKNVPFGDDTPNFERYRLSQNRMIIIQNKSSLWRATCSFDQSDPIAKTRDSMIGAFRNVDLFAPLQSEVCDTILFINVRGFQCTNCSTIIKRLKDRTVYIALKASADNCDFKADLVSSSGGEQPFGFYSTKRTDFRCTENNESTTNWWFGEKLA